MLKRGYMSVILFSGYSLFACILLCVLLQAGPGLFKVANFSTWMVLPTTSELVEDIRKAPDDILAHMEPKDEVPALLVVC